MTDATHAHCPLCCSPDFVVLPGYEDHKLVECSGCGFVFSNQIPTTRQLDALYEQDYTRTDYHSPVTIKRYNELLDVFEKYRQHNRILDIGCGIGYFLVEARKRGWEVYGTEYSVKAIKVCRQKGIKVYTDMSEMNEGMHPECFDVIVSMEVLEHLNFPQKMLEEANNWLRFGGMYYITVPNFNSFSRHYLKSNWVAGICAPEHLSYFTTKTISRIFVNAGFRKEKLLTTGISLVGLKKPKKYTAAEFLSADARDERTRVNIESSRLLRFIKDSFNFTLNLFRLGDTIKGWFVKV